jgi:transcriptional regulator with XRE-family HTH domain
VNPESTEIRFSETENSAHVSIWAKLRLGMAEKSEETIQRILSSYEIGQKLRKLRLRKKIGLVDLGKHTGLSASMLSQLENGKLIPTLPTLARISMVFDVSIDHFFSSKKRQAVFSIVRAKERIPFPERADAPNPNFFFECLAFSAQNKSLQAYLAEFPRSRDDSATEHAHEGAEFLHVLEGSLCIRMDGDEHVLKPGDSVYFDGSEPHAYVGLSKKSARAIVITTPPRL